LYRYSKGRLKEQDPFIEFIVDLFKTHETEEALGKAEKWLDESLKLPPHKRKFANIYRQVPKLGYYFHSLPLTKAGLYKLNPEFVLVSMISDSRKIV
jgi:IMP and pyridine-specific 5'-nucleotidase